MSLWIKYDMRIVVYKNDSVPENAYLVVANLLHDAFAERIGQGIYFSCASFTPEDVKSVLTECGYLFLAYDHDNIPMGTVMLLVSKKRQFIYGRHENLAVSSNFKRKGVGAALFNKLYDFADKLNLDFLTSVTAVNASSSVNWHKKRGFLIYSKNYGEKYDSYSFVLPIRKLRILYIRPVRWAIYHLLSFYHRIRK